MVPTMGALRWGPARRLGRVAVLALAGLAGCGDSGSSSSTSPPPKEPVHPVQGKVVLADGKPLTKGTVTFVPVKEAGRLATGEIQSDGTYTLGTKDLGAGAPEGDYRVKVESPLTAPMPGKAKESRVVVPPKYQDEDTSGLKVTVKAGPNDIPIQLK